MDSAVLGKITKGRRKDRAVDELVGICRGLLADGHVNLQEAQFLREWIERNLGSHYTLLLRMDSELIVKQLRGEYKVKAEHLQPIWLLAMNAVAAFDDVAIDHVPRSENARADALANQALDARD